MARKNKESREYWRDREIEHAKLMLKDDQEFSKTLAALYRSTSTEIENTVTGMLERYASKNGLSVADVRKRLTATDIRDYEAKAARYVKEKDFSPLANEEMAIYNLKMRTSRLDLINAHINLDLTALTDEVDKLVGERLIDAGQAETLRQAGILGATITIDRSGLEYIARRNFHGDDFSGHLWKNKRLLHGELKKRLAESITTGQSSKVAARKLRQTVEQNVSNSQRIMVTELARVQSEVQKESYKQADISMYEFIATEGGCKICAPLDGERFNVSDAMPGSNMAPMHPHCRCSSGPYYE
ncbi:minor capsid protein [Planomicrobium okeanokoites]|uniref:Minor capsid protein n=1 Tax=Planomicrobium okeanokoites TaxID=244 RepID=A0ABV7KTW3_PLAOK|nr:minor capsid protein [Planomicrobium okeanokoites]TAA71601.1 hypothetical protein D2910_04805 [Planomicrobium okeanokoites]